MKTHLFTLLLLSSVLLKAQTTSYCASDQARKKLLEQYPELQQQEQELDAFTRNFLLNYNNLSREGNIVIPVVFHIIHNGDINPTNGELITDAQILDQVRILNEDYNKRNADLVNVIPVFQPVVANVGIEFRMANLDPDGNPTNGIIRVNSVQTYVGNDFSKLNSWPKERYLNIWVVKSMEDGVAGYSYFPGTIAGLSTPPARDGVILLSDYVGAVGTGNLIRSHALTHEVGHYLNLKHTWGDTNAPGIACGDDDVNDTPETRGATACTLNLSYCNPPIIENVQNFMDYSYCSNMFTEGQKVRMLAALNSPLAGRNNLWSADNLANTGVDDTIYTAAQPKADFASPKRYVCLGTSIQLADASFNGEVTDYYWEFANGIPATSGDKNPTVQFTTTGWQPIKLTVTGPGGSSTIIKNDYIFVANDLASYIAPFTQSFEDQNSLTNNEWVAINNDHNITEIKRTDIGTHTGNGVAMLNNYYATADRDIDEVVSPGFDMSSLTPSQLSVSFYYSWAKSSTSTNNNPPDSIEVQATLNCGATWQTIYKKGSTAVLNAGEVTGYFIPTQSSSYWKYIKINLANSWKKPNVRFKFKVYGSTHGNNFYLDDINIGTALTGIQNISVVNNVNIYPNPTEGNATIALSLASAGNITVSITDLTGKVVAKVHDGYLNDGENQLPVSGLSAMAAGVYIVNVKAGESVMQKKLIVN